MTREPLRLTIHADRDPRTGHIRSVSLRPVVQVAHVSPSLAQLVSERRAEGVEVTVYVAGRGR